MHPKLSALFLAALFSFGAAATHAETHVVVQSGISFTPQTLSVAEGDVVRWEWTNGSHTVTSGTGFADPNVAAFFDTPLNSASPSFEYTFTTVGSYPYFCRPHEPFNMKGTVIVEGPTPTEPRTWGAIKSLYEREAPRD